MACSSLEELLALEHEYVVETASVQMVKDTVDVYSRTSDIAGWSVVELLRNLDSPIVL